MRRGRDDREALRRRLYRPDPSPDDLRRYSAAAPAAARSAARAAPADAATARRRPPRRLLLAAAVLVVVAAVAAPLLLRASSRPPLPAPTAVGLSAEDRAELLDNLARGGDAGIAAYLVTHPSPPGLVTSPGTITDEVHGDGAATLPLDLSQVPAGAGRATVLVVTASPAEVTWRTLRLGTAGSPAVVLRPLAARRGDQAAGDLTTATTAYAEGRRPSRLRVEVADGVRWGAAVVFTPAAEGRPSLR